MSFSLEIEDAAVASIKRLPPPVRLHIVNSLPRLKENPELEGKPTSGLYAKGYMLELEYALGDLEFYIDVLYRIDEQANVVTVFQVLWEYV